MSDDDTYQRAIPIRRHQVAPRPFRTAITTTLLSLSHRFRKGSGVLMSESRGLRAGAGLGKGVDGHCECFFRDTELMMATKTMS